MAQEIKNNGRFKQEHEKSCHSTTEMILSMKLSTG